MLNFVKNLFKKKKPSEEVWVVFIMLNGGMLGISGVFSSFDKAEERTKEEMQTITNTSKKSSVDWKCLEIKTVFIYNYDCWDVLLHVFKVDDGSILEI